VYTHIQEYLPFQLQTVDSGFDLVWLSKTNSNVVEYLVDPFFYLYFTSFSYNMVQTSVFFSLSYSNIDRIPRFRRMSKSYFLSASRGPDDILRNV
jgi:hypothetical protein